MLAAHFSLEEDVCFPALARLWPEMRGRIADLAREHDRFREELDQIQRRLGASEREGAEARFDRLVVLASRIFSPHEKPDVARYAPAQMPM